MHKHEIDSRGMVKESRIVFHSATDSIQNKFAYQQCLYVISRLESLLLEFLQVTISNSDFSQCHAKKTGGAIAAQFIYDSMTIQHSTFSDGSVDVSGSGDGAGIYLLSGGALSVLNTTFLRNTAEQGGAICLISCKSVELQDSEFAHNSAAGMVRVYPVLECPYPLKAPIYVVEFDLLSVLIQGGGVYMQQAESLTVQGCKIHDNSAAGIGGGILATTTTTEATPEDGATSDTSAIVEDCQIEANTAELVGLPTYHWIQKTLNTHHNCRDHNIISVLEIGQFDEVSSRQSSISYGCRVFFRAKPRQSFPSWRSNCLLNMSCRQFSLLRMMSYLLSTFAEN